MGATRTATVSFTGETAANDGYRIQRGCYDEPYAGVGSRLTGGPGTGAGTQNVSLRWRVLVNNGEIAGRPAAASDGSVVIGTTQGTLAVYSQTGDLTWRVYSGPVVSGPVVGPDGTIYLAGSNRIVQALTPSGTVIWTHQRPTPLVASPTFIDSMINQDGALVPAGVIVGDLQGNVTKLMLDGTVAWTFATAGEVRASVSAMSDGRVLFTSTDGGVYCVHGINGSLSWSYNAGQEVSSRPLVQDVSIVFGTRQNQNRPGRLVALTTNGVFRWELNLTSSVESEPIQHPRTGTVYFSSNDGKIWAVRTDGVLLWRYVTGGAGGICGNQDNVPDTQGSPSSGAKCTSSELRVQGATSPVLCGGTLVTTSQNKYVYGLGPQDGALRWKFQTGRRIRSPARCVETRDAFGQLTAAVYTGSGDRHLYALDIPVAA